MYKKLPRFCIFWFFLRDEEFVSKTTNDNNIDLNKFPVSKVRQHVKKMESSKATAKHIKQVVSDPHLPKSIWCVTSTLSYHPASFKDNRRNIWSQGKIQTSNIIIMKKNKEGHQWTRNMKHMQAQIDIGSVVIHNVLRDLDVQLASTIVKVAISLVPLVAWATRRKSLNTRESKVPEHINWRLV